MENQEPYEVTNEQQPSEMLTIKFSRKLTRPFTTKSGRDMVAISIPNEDPADNRSWDELL